MRDAGPPEPPPQAIGRLNQSRRTDSGCPFDLARARQHGETMLNPENQLIRLQAVDPARNIARQYEILVQRDLFGALTVDYSWGRIGTAGQSRRVSLGDADRGERFVRQILARRKTANARIGVAYRRV